MLGGVEQLSLDTPRSSLKNVLGLKRLGFVHGNEQLKPSSQEKNDKLEIPGGDSVRENELRENSVRSKFSPLGVWKSKKEIRHEAPKKF